VITGKTRVVGIIADPIAHVRTPQTFNALMARAAGDAVMVPLQVRAQDLEGFLQGIRHARNLDGLVVTLPHKEAIVAFCSELTPIAERVRAVNAVRFEHDRGATIGTNTDGEGFVAGLKLRNFQVQGRRVYLAGAGGAAKAIAEALLGEGVAALGIYNRTQARATEMVDRLRSAHPGRAIDIAGDAPDQFSLAINATSLGLTEGDPLPFRLDRLDPSATVAEVVMKVDVTPLLDDAQKRGHAIHLGRHMLDGQVERIAHFLGLSG